MNIREQRHHLLDPRAERLPAGQIGEVAKAHESCLGDLEPLARKLISVEPGTAEVTASGFLLETATSRYAPDFGCSLRD